MGKLIDATKTSPKLFSGEDVKAKATIAKSIRSIEEFLFEQKTRIDIRKELANRLLDGKR